MQWWDQEWKTLDSSDTQLWVQRNCGLLFKSIFLLDNIFANIITHFLLFNPIKAVWSIWSKKIGKSSNMVERSRGVKGYLDGGSASILLWELVWTWQPISGSKRFEYVGLFSDWNKFSRFRRTWRILHLGCPALLNISIPPKLGVLTLTFGV